VLGVGLGLLLDSAYELAATAIPVHPQMQRTHVETDWLGDETYGQTTTFTYLTKLEHAQLWDFYRGQLLPRGWQETSYVNDGIGGSFARGSTMIRLWMGAADAEDRYVRVTYVP
jgi:hypothetical protein